MIPKQFELGMKVIKKIEENGYQAFLVGGCVRDWLIKRNIGDIDITTSAKPEQIQHLFEDTIPVGIEHGTVIVRFQGQSFEVTTFRIDGEYSDQRHPDSVEYTSRVELDLERRDFTINALAMNSNGEIIDLFGGQKDLNQALIRTVGDGHKRFQEDPLRIIRGIRFASQLGFAIEEKTLEAMDKTKSQLENIAIERIVNELEKMFSGEAISKGLQYIKTLQLDQHLPILASVPLMEKLPAQMKPLYSIGEVITLFHFYSKTVRISTWISEWKCSKKVKKQVVQLSEAINYLQDQGLDEWLVYKLDEANFSSLIRLVNIILPQKGISLIDLERLHNQLVIKSKKDLAIDGNDIILMNSNRKKGPWIYKALNIIELKVVKGELTNSKSELKEWLEWNLQEID